MDFAVNLNILEILKYPETINRLKILSPIRYDKLNTILGPISNLQYHYHENILYFLGDSKQLVETLDKEDIRYEEIEPLEVNIARDFPILRVLIYKALRRYFTRIGFTWDRRRGRKNVAFITNPKPKLVRDIKKQFDVDLIHTLVGVSPETSNLVKVTVHEGFRYKVDMLKDIPTLVIRRKVTPLIQVDLSSIDLMSSVVCVCKLSCPFKTICKKIPRKKINVNSYSKLDRTYDICPEGYRELVNIIDKSGKSYEIPAHTIHIEANTALMSRIGVYKDFRNIAIKWPKEWSTITQALLYYLSEGKEKIEIDIGRDTLIISATPIGEKVEVDKDVWKKYRVED